ncbi:hypothetical protein Cpir12675_002851 [Ceratocystis pirilliformis]|uniref:37S ribosomal protein S35 mitochondrial n=1 Tax=Ceratocystis pirilliformis TaxID=259994 RepID=A0ABR3Z6H5_9PEZI
MSVRLGTTALRAMAQASVQVSPMHRSSTITRHLSTSSSCAGRLDPMLRERGLRTLGRQDMKRFLDRLDSRWRERQSNGGNRSSGFYLGPHPDQPFPLNPQFRSQPVLSEPAREWIWRRVVQKGEALKVVSADMSVDIRRVAAVVRLKEVEKRWLQNGKKLATPYSEAIMSMLPQTQYFIPNNKNPQTAPHEPHEPINEIHTHGHTLQQLFWPVAESRAFTREDAASAFSPIMLTPERRSPHTELIDAEKAVTSNKMSRTEAMDMWRQRAEKNQADLNCRMEEKLKTDRACITSVHTDRFEFRFKDFNSENVGKLGRKRDAVGHKYGVPNYNRKRGAVKIPTSVP